MKPVVSFTVSLATFLATNAFVVVPSSPSSGNTRLHVQMSEFGESEDQSVVSSRRQWMADALAKSVAFGTLVSSVTPASAEVFVDPDRYGDKELKLATVNKLRQTIRDTLLQDPKLAPLFLKVAIQDAITFNAATEGGGPDGSIVAVILSKDAPANLAPLKPAAEKLSEIAVKIKRTTEATVADIVAFAGAEAIESSGGPRVVIQLGKMDPAKGAKSVSSNQYPDICGKSGSGREIIDGFLSAGLSEREVALLYGAIGAMERVVDSIEPQEEEEEEENEMGDKDVFIPSSFGAPSQIYGQKLGSIDNTIFVDVVSDLSKKRAPIADVFTDEKVAAWATKYAGKKGGFLKDLPEAYAKIMSLGTKYTGGTIGSLLGGSDDV